MIRQWITDGAPAGTPPAAAVALALTATSPIPNMRLARVPQQLVVAFSREIDFSLVNETTLSLEQLAPQAAPQVLPPMHYSLAAGNPAAVLMRPAVPLANGTYRLHVRGTGAAALADLNGSALGEDAVVRVHGGERAMSARRLSWLGLLLVLLAARASAEPYLAVANGYKCGQCHVNPTGGGERTAFGEIFSQTSLPAQHVDTGTDVWTGAINRFISLGGDGRYQFEAQQVPGQTTTNQFELGAGARVPVGERDPRPAAVLRR